MTKTFSLTLILLSVLTVAPAFSQVGPQRFSIPFQFTVEGVQFDAGDYNVTAGPSSQTMTIRSLDGKKSAVFVTVGSNWKPGSAATLAFRMFETSYLLESVSLAETQRDLVAYAKKGESRYAYVMASKARS